MSSGTARLACGRSGARRRREPGTHGHDTRDQAQIGTCGYGPRGRLWEPPRMRAELPALVVRLHGPFDLGIGCGFRRNSRRLAVAILNRRKLQLVVLALLVEQNARAGA